MVYAIRLASSIGPFYFLMPACFDHGTGHTWSPLGMPARARKFSTGGEATIYCKSLPFACEVVPLPGTGHAYEGPPAPAPADPAHPNGEAR